MIGRNEGREIEAAFLEQTFGPSAEHPFCVYVVTSNSI